jgi:hypothetical protein
VWLNRICGIRLCVKFEDVGELKIKMEIILWELSGAQMSLFGRTSLEQNREVYL